jgi:hypothetical protein
MIPQTCACRQLGEPVLVRKPPIESSPLQDKKYERKIKNCIKETGGELKIFTQDCSVKRTDEMYDRHFRI